MKKNIFLVFACLLFILGAPGNVKAQTCGFNAANDYTCGDTGGAALGDADSPEIPRNDTFQAVVAPGGGFVARPLFPIDYDHPEHYSSPPNADSYECAGGGFEEFKEHLKLREGVRNDVYLDSLGNPTVGVGHLVLPEDGLSVGDTISDAQVDAFLDRDAQWAWDAAQQQMEEAGIDDPCFQVALGSVNYQLGSGWRDKFPNTWRAIAEGRYCEAADMLDGTRWQEQTPVRVADFQAALRDLCGGGGSTTVAPRCTPTGGWGVEKSDQAIAISQSDDAEGAQCAKGVANIMLEMGYPVTRGDAYTWGTTLPANGWECLPGVTPENAPAGAILFFNNDAGAGKSPRGTPGGNFGHVEIVTVDSGGRRYYTSDKARSNWGGTVPDNFECAYVHPSMGMSGSDGASAGTGETCTTPGGSGPFSIASMLGTGSLGSLSSLFGDFTGDLDGLLGPLSGALGDLGSLDSLLSGSLGDILDLEGEMSDLLSAVDLDILDELGFELPTDLTDLLGTTDLLGDLGLEIDGILGDLSSLTDLSDLTDLNALLDGALGDITGLADFQDTIDGLMGDLGDIDSFLSDIGDFSDIASSLDGMMDAFDSFSDMSAIQDALDQFGDMTAMIDDITALQDRLLSGGDFGDVSGLIDSLGGPGALAGDLDSMLDQLSEFSDLQTALGDLTGGIGDLSTLQDELDGLMGDLSSFTDLQSEFGSIVSDFEGLNDVLGDIGGLESMLSDLDGQLAAMTDISQLSSMVGDLSSLSSSMDMLSDLSAITDLQDRMTTITESFSSMAGLEDSLANLSDITAQMEDFQTSLDSIGDLSSSLGDISDLSSQMSDMQGTLDSLREGLM